MYRVDYRIKRSVWLACLFMLMFGCQGQPNQATNQLDRPEGTQHCAVTDVENKESWSRALKAAQTAFKSHQEKLKRTDIVTVINFDTLHLNSDSAGDNLDRLRVYDVSKGWSRVRSSWVSHAQKSGSKCPVKFSNRMGKKFTSRGAYVTHSKTHKSNRFGFPALNVDGLEPGLNDLARKRLIKFHQAIDKKNNDKKIDVSEGCFMTRPSVNKALTEQIAGGTLVYVYSSLPVIDAAAKK